MTVKSFLHCAPPIMVRQTEETNEASFFEAVLSSPLLEVDKGVSRIYVF